MSNTSPPPAFDAEKRIAQFVKLRDKIAEIEKRHKEELKQFKEMKDKLAAMLLDHLNQTGSDSIKAHGAGTAYRRKVVSATIADQREFRRHVLGAEEFDLVNWAINKPALEAFMEANGGQLPPGVNYSAMFEIGVRRD